MTPPLLSIDLLEEYADRLRSQGAPAIEAANSGLSRDQMQELANQVGLTLPGEAQVWWGWRNGVTDQSSRQVREIAAGGEWLPLEEAVSECIRIREMIENVAEQDPRPAEALWSSAWLPLVHADGLYVIDTGGLPEAPVPVRVHHFYEPETPHDVASMGELVQTWIDAIDRGAWRYDQEVDRWTTDLTIVELLPGGKRGVV